MILRACRIALLWLAILPVAHAEEHASALALAAIAGDWQGSGTTNGMPSNQRLLWEPVLNGQFLRLTLDNRMATPAGKEWQFQAQAFYRVQPDGTIGGTWFDSRGYTFPLKGSVNEAGVLTIIWGSDETERSP